MASGMILSGSKLVLIKNMIIFQKFSNVVGYNFFKTSTYLLNRLMVQYMFQRIASDLSISINRDSNMFFDSDSFFHNSILYCI